MESLSMDNRSRSTRPSPVKEADVEVVEDTEVGSVAAVVVEVMIDIFIVFSM